MKRSILFALLLVLLGTLNSVGFIIDSETSQEYNLAELQEVIYDVNIDNQVAMVKVEETFINTNYPTFVPRYYFPMQAGASAIMIRWYQNSQWYEANINASPQNPQGGPSYTPTNIQDYLGDQVPVIFDLPFTTTFNDTIKIEITYVQLLEYAYGNVNLFLQNDYSAIQAAPINHQLLNIDLVSDREIETYEIAGLGANFSEIGLYQVHTIYDIYESTSIDYDVTFSLNQEELGLWSMSTYLDSVPDEEERGFFTMIVEPDPSENTEVIDKVFTLIIDTSGSMSGDKILQAKETAIYIVNNLNEGDKFNIITFASLVTPLWTSHQDFNSENQATALSFINEIYAQGSTNISGAFDLAVPQFNNLPGDTANIIVFMTDGEATEGIYNTPSLINHLDDLFSACDVSLSLFNFGIGNSVNETLLSSSANEHGGFATYLRNNELYSVITDFYNMIRNPVMLDTEIAISPSNILFDIHPVSLPNLYKGKQMIISGRYSEAVDIEINFSGRVYGDVVNYQYNVSLSDSVVTNNAFLPKIWAKQKIEDLLQEYYAYQDVEWVAENIKEEIIALSQMWGVLTPFTSFIGDGVDNYDEEIEDNQVENSSIITILGNYPNPFNPETQIRFDVKEDINDVMLIKIYNLKGQLVKIIEVKVGAKGQYSVIWKGDNQENKAVASGIYFYKIEYAEHTANGKMILMK